MPATPSLTPNDSLLRSVETPAPSTGAWDITLCVVPSVLVFVPSAGERDDEDDDDDDEEEDGVLVVP
jgi:hypothetical protein